MPTITALLAARPEDSAGRRRRNDEDRLHARSAIPRSAAGAVGPGSLAVDAHLRPVGPVGRDDARSATGRGRVVDDLGRQSDVCLHPAARDEVPQRPGGHCRRRRLQLPARAGHGRQGTGQGRAAGCRIIHRDWAARIHGQVEATERRLPGELRPLGAADPQQGDRGRHRHRAGRHRAVHASSSGSRAITPATRRIRSTGTPRRWRAGRTRS